jgi:type II secretory pathway pseudopilin PulG
MGTESGQRDHDPCVGQREDGFTIVEVLVAAVILVLASLAIFMAFGASIHGIQRSRETQIGVSVAQREMERIRVIPYDNVAITTTPTVMTSAEKLEKPENREPRWRVRVNGSATEFDLARPASKEEWKPMMVSSTAGQVAAVSSGTQKVTASDGTEVEVDRFVTCEEPSGTVSTCKAKRIVVDVIPIGKNNLGNYKHGYYELQSTLVDPTP